MNNIIFIKKLFGYFEYQIYFHTETLERDLYQLLKSNIELTKDHRRFFLYQILRALKYICIQRI